MKNESDEHDMLHSRVKQAEQMCGEAHQITFHMERARKENINQNQELERQLSAKHSLIEHH